MKLIAALLVLLSWDMVLHNCDPLKPWQNDIGRYGYRVANRTLVWTTCTTCDDSGICADEPCPHYDTPVWSPWRYVDPAGPSCSVDRCAGSAMEGNDPPPGSILVYEVKAEDQSLNSDCGI